MLFEIFFLIKFSLRFLREVDKSCRTSCYESEYAVKDAINSGICRRCNLTKCVRCV
jgi:hypothetical protein